MPNYTKKQEKGKTAIVRQTAVLLYILMLFWFCAPTRLASVPTWAESGLSAFANASSPGWYQGHSFYTHLGVREDPAWEESRSRLSACTGAVSALEEYRLTGHLLPNSEGSESVSAAMP